MHSISRQLPRALESLTTITRPLTHATHPSRLAPTQATSALLAKAPTRTLAAVASPAGLATPSNTSAMSTPISANAILDIIKNRRTYYPLNKELTITPERIQEIVQEGLLHVPSSFNSQSNRVVVLFGAEHERLWDITTEILKSVVPEDRWQPTGDKMAMFRAAAGTVMFFEDQAVVDGFASKFPLYADKFPVWATQSDAMLQYLLWTALEAEGLGANLQHYNPLIDSKVAEQWKLPSTWRLNAQLVFGGRVATPSERTYQPLETRYKVFGA